MEAGEGWYSCFVRANFETEFCETAFEEDGSVFVGGCELADEFVVAGKTWLGVQVSCSESIQCQLIHIWIA